MATASGGALEGKVALIIGGTSGIGEAAAKLFRSEGALVVVAGANDAHLERALATSGIHAFECDVQNIASISHVMNAVAGLHGCIDVLFANAGIPGRQTSIEEVDEETFDKVLAINLKGMFFCVQKALPLMGAGSAVVLTASMAAHEAMSSNVAYGASKAGVRSMGRSLAGALLPRGIRVNVLTPGLINTPMNNNMGPGGDEAIAAVLSKIPMGRMGTVDEAAAVALFLASSASSFMTGGEIKMGGGQTDL